MFNAFITLFSEADWLFYVLLVLSICLLVAELFIPNFSIAGIGGIIMTIATITERCAHGKNTANELLLYIIYTFGIIVLCVWTVKMIYVTVRSRNKVKYTTVDGNKVPLTKEGFLDYSFLIGEEGVVITDLKPTGKVRFDKGAFEATSIKEYIYSGSTVVADRILNGKIIVKKK